MRSAAATDAARLEGAAPALAEALAPRQEPAEALLRALVDQPSGSDDREGVARVLDRVAEELARVGAAVEMHAEDGLPRHLTARLRGGRAAGGVGAEAGAGAGAGADRAEGAGRAAAPSVAAAPPRLLVIGHADTVFPKSERRLLSADDERFYGPGATDMKGGLVVALEALRAAGPLLAEGPPFEVEVIVNGDEELGSPSSRALIRERARGARAALVFENCEREDAAIVARKGLGWAQVAIEGRAAHAGINPDEGASALVEAAHQIIDLSRLHDPRAGVGVVVGMARGGRSRNTVPPDAELLIDVRYEDKERGERAFEALRQRGSRTVVAGTRARFEGELHRPPMRADAAHQRWIHAHADRVARLAGLEGLAAIASGGGSDANLTADLGVPSVDGLGVIGGAIHTRREWGLRRSLVRRALLAALLLVSIPGLAPGPDAA